MDSRINLVVKALIETQDPDTILEIVEIRRVMKSLSRLAKLFGPKTIWRAILRKQAENDKIRPHNLKKITTTRWANDKRVALVSVQHMYPSIIKTLRARAESASITTEQKNEVQDLVDIMTDKNYVSTLAFMIDFYEVLDRYSKWVQKDSSTRLNVALFRQRFMAGMRRLFVGPLHHLSPWRVPK